jgi:hypothetical protein
VTATWLGPLHDLWDWTDGCIAVSNREMREIGSKVPNGTPIEIRNGSVGLSRSFPPEPDRSYGIQIFSAAAPGARIHSASACEIGTSCFYPTRLVVFECPHRS